MLRAAQLLRRLSFFSGGVAMDQYRTVKNEAEDEFVERRSRFIGRVKPVKTEGGRVSFIRACKSKYWDASHNVYAYSLREGSVRRYSDDGEPQGTAGVRCWRCCKKAASPIWW